MAARQISVTTVDSSFHGTAHCLECHGASLAQESPQSIFHQTGEHCSRCHSFHQPTRLIAGQDTTDLKTAQSRSAICSDCHRTAALPEITPGHRAAAHLAHSGDSGSLAGTVNSFCLGCHDISSSTPGSLASSEFVPPRLHLSASHSYDGILLPGTQLPNSHFRLQSQISEIIRTVDGNMSCLSCHSFTSTNPSLLVATIEDGLCTNCHDMQRFSTTPLFTSQQQ